MTTREPMRIGIVGCGAISAVYFEAGKRFVDLDIVACADVDPARSAQAASRYGVPAAASVDALLADDSVEVVVDLTPPKVHRTVNNAALSAGKHAYAEKPLATTVADARSTLELARASGRRVGCAPDTFLGAGLQTCRALLDQGAIGTPVAGSAFVLGHGPDNWHPNPAFFYQEGAGPLLDIGPYYVTALVSLLGPVGAVVGSARTSFSERPVTSGANAGSVIHVEVPTHVTGVLEMASGPPVTVATSFDVWASEMPCIEIYGSEGTLSVPDPNRFGGPVRLRRAGEKAWEEIVVDRPYAEQSRGVGLADMVAAIRGGRPHRASAELAFHALDVMESLLRAAHQGRRVTIESTAQRPAPLPADLTDGEIDQ